MSREHGHNRANQAYSTRVVLDMPVKLMKWVGGSQILMEEEIVDLDTDVWGEWIRIIKRRLSGPRKWWPWAYAQSPAPSSLTSKKISRNTSTIDVNDDDIRVEIGDSHRRGYENHASSSSRTRLLWTDLHWDHHHDGLITEVMINVGLSTARNLVASKPTTPVYNPGSVTAAGLRMAGVNRATGVYIYESFL